MWALVPDKQLDELKCASAQRCVVEERWLVGGEDFKDLSTTLQAPQIKRNFGESIATAPFFDVLFQMVFSHLSSQATRHWPRVKIKDKKIISRSSLPERQAARAINHPLGSINQRNSAHISPPFEFQPWFSSGPPHKEIIAWRGKKGSGINHRPAVAPAPRRGRPNDTVACWDLYAAVPCAAHPAPCWLVGGRPPNGRMMNDGYLFLWLHVDPSASDPVAGAPRRRFFQVTSLR